MCILRNAPLRGSSSKNGHFLLVEIGMLDTQSSETHHKIDQTWTPHEVTCSD